LVSNYSESYIYNNQLFNETAHSANGLLIKILGLFLSKKLDIKNSGRAILLSFFFRDVDKEIKTLGTRWKSLVI
ncbi:unnamed protein product, partial [Porites lobata]